MLKKLESKVWRFYRWIWWKKKKSESTTKSSVFRRNESKEYTTYKKCLKCYEEIKVRKSSYKEQEYTVY